MHESNLIDETRTHGFTSHNLGLNILFLRMIA